MKLLEIVRQVLDTKVITTEIENQIRSLLWTPNLTAEELTALQQLMEEMSRGSIEYLMPGVQQEWFAA